MIFLKLCVVIEFHALCEQPALTHFAIPNGAILEYLRRWSLIDHSYFLTAFRKTDRSLASLELRTDHNKFLTVHFFSKCSRGDHIRSIAARNIQFSVHAASCNDDGIRRCFFDKVCSYFCSGLHLYVVQFKLADQICFVILDLLMRSFDQ